MSDRSSRRPTNHQGSCDIRAERLEGRRQTIAQLRSEFLTGHDGRDRLGRTNSVLGPFSVLLTLAFSSLYLTALQSVALEHEETAVVVNVAPTIAFATNLVTVTEDSGAKTLAYFASFAAGPANEATQSITNVTTTCSNPVLFSFGPLLDTNGTLAFTPAPDSSGLAIVTVIVQDNGGTANAGISKATNSFTIEITQINDAPSVRLTGNRGGVESWVQPSVANSSGDAITTDNHGNVYVAGSSNNTGLLIIKYKVDGTPVWTNLLDASVDGFVSAEKMAFDAAGNLIMAGTAYDPTIGYYYLTLKFQANGTLLWTNSYIGIGGNAHFANSLALDTNGSVFVTGTSRLSSVGDDYDIVTIKYQADGLALWTNRYAGLTGGRDDAQSLLVDPENAVYVIGRADGVDGTAEFVTIKYSDDGIEQWVNRYRPAGNVYSAATHSTFDADGNVAVIGNSIVSTNRVNDYVRVTYSPTGLALSTNRFYGIEGVRYSTVSGVFAERNGNLYLTGRFVSPASGNDFLTIKFNPDGTRAWTNIFSGPATNGDYPGGLVVDNIGNVYVAGGSYRPGSDFDFVTIKYHADGTPAWTNVYNGGSNGSDVVSAIAVDDEGNVYLTGYEDGRTTTIRYAAARPVVVDEDTGPQIFAAFASFIVGPPAEGGQTITNVLTSNNNPALFDAQPVVELDGILRFTPAPGVNGIASVTVIAQDNGGLADGGVDKATNVFTITVTAVNDPPIASITNLTNGQVFLTGDRIRVQSAASDADGQVVSVDFLVGTNLIATLTNAPFEVWLTNLPQATNFTISVRATDDAGATSSSSGVSVVVRPPGIFLLSQPVLLPNLSVDVQLTSPDIGREFRFEFSDDLTVWNLRSIGMNVNGNVHFTDQPPPGSVGRYYRACLQSF